MNLKVLTTQERTDPHHFDKQQHYATMTIAEDYNFFFYLTLFFRSGKKLKRVTAQAEIDLNYLAWQHCLDHYTTVAIAEDDAHRLNQRHFVQYTLCMMHPTTPKRNRQVKLCKPNGGNPCL